MSETLTIADFFAAGEPKPMGRPRAFTFQGRARVYNPSTAEGWKGAVAIAARPHLPAEPITGPVSVDITFLLPRPKRLYRKRDPDGEVVHDRKPDRDNLEKSVLDALTSIGFWRDDGQVCDGRVRKFYHAKDGRPGARIVVRRIPA